MAAGFCTGRNVSRRERSPSRQALLCLSRSRRSRRGGIPRFCETGKHDDPLAPAGPYGPRVPTGKWKSLPLPAYMSPPEETALSVVPWLVLGPGFPCGPATQEHKRPGLAPSQTRGSRASIARPGTAPCAPLGSRCYARRAPALGMRSETILLPAPVVKQHF